MNYASLDTGVIVEYIDLDSRFHTQATAILQSIEVGRLSAIIPHPVLAETHYVATRIYERLCLDKTEERSEKLLNWLYSSPNVTIPEPSLELAILSGKIKNNFRLALTDSYVLASSKIYNSKAVFRTKEREMTRILPQLEKEHNILFLEDYATIPM